MTAYSVINAANLTAGQPEDVSVVLANFNAIAAVVNALDNTNIAPAAGIAYAKLNLAGGIVNADISPSAGIQASKITGLGSGAFVPIADVLLSSPQATIDIPGIPQTYTHLVLVTSLRCSGATGNDQAEVRFNNDSGNNYAYQFLRAGGSSASASENLSASFVYLGQPAGASAPANAFDVATMDINDYASSSKNKATLSRFSTRGADTTGGFQMGHCAGFWKSNAAITQLTIICNSTFIAGSRATLYGMVSTVPSPSSPALTAPVPATTLPSSPADGQQAILTDNTSTPTYSWLLQWSAAAAKWIFIGGSAASSEIQTAENVNSTTYVDLATVGPQFTCPRAGIYEVSFGAVLNPLQANGPYQAFAAPKWGANATQDTNAATLEDVSAGALIQVWASVGRIIRSPVMSASDVIKMQYRTNASGAATFWNRYMKVTPVYLT
ncbi:MAG TPA: hypothetical protein VH593_24085 [Ktedonobacteraceae bacterium]